MRRNLQDRETESHTPPARFPIGAAADGCTSLANHATAVRGQSWARNRFFTPEDQQKDSIDGISWAVNCSQECQREIEALLGNPKVMMSLEGRNVIPPLNKTPKSEAAGNTLFAADKKKVGGLTHMGAANFNLFTKAIELACGGIFAMREYIADGIKRHRDGALSAHNGRVLVDRHNVMRQSYDDETLTGFGLTYR